VAALEAIRERILHGQLAEGEQIRQVAVAAEFGISAIRSERRFVGDSGEAERLFRKEAERHSGMIPNTIGA